MQISASNYNRKDITTVIYSILTRHGLSVKFKVKLFTKDRNQDEQFYHQEFVLPKDKVCINLSPRPYLEWVLCNPNQDGAKVAIYVTEVYKQRIVRKLTKMAALLEAYDDGEIDILTVGANGTHIRSEASEKVKITVGKQSIQFKPFFNENAGKVEVIISAEGSITSINVVDFLMLFYRLKELNFTHTTIALMSYVGTAPLGMNQTDFRRNKINQEIEIDDIIQPRSYNKISVMGNLIDIDDPTGVIKPDPNSKRPNW